MTIGLASRTLFQELKQLYSPGEASRITDLVFEKITGYTPTSRILHKNSALSAKQETEWQRMRVALLTHRPLQYVVEEAWFCGLPFYVNEAVLIPRPETEELVEWVLSYLNNTDHAKSILDAGTGSGCIAIALKQKKKKSTSSVWALDKFPEALEVARRNASTLGTDIHFIQADLEKVKTMEGLPSLDVIVSNPPYIPVKDRKEMHKNVVDFEPGTSLFVPDSDPLLFYNKILTLARSKLKPGGAVFVEIHENLGEAVKTLFEQQLTGVILRKDWSGKDRMICGFMK